MTDTAIPEPVAVVEEAKKKVEEIVDAAAGGATSDAGAEKPDAPDKAKDEAATATTGNAKPRGGRGDKGRKRGGGANRDRGRPRSTRAGATAAGADKGGTNRTADSARMLHVSGQSPVKQVAGAISWISREGECPRLLATLAPAINQAAKAVAIARKFLEDDKIDISVFPMFTPGRRRQDESFTFLLRKSMTRGVVQGEIDDGTQELKVSKQSNPGTVAGAIAARVREGQRVVLSSIGPRSVSKAICSIAIARQYLSEDGVDISFRPSFLNIEFEDGRRSSCLQFQLLAQQV